MRRLLLIALSLTIPLLAAGSAQAIVVNDSGTHAGVALMPGSGLPSGVSSVTPSCSPDPGLTPDLAYRVGTDPLCWDGGAVMHQNETFALTWDPDRLYWETTRGYVEQFLKDVAGGSNSLGSPFPVATQYMDDSGRAQNSSIYGGGCIDYGNPGGYTCEFGNTSGSGTGNNYPSASCSAGVSGDICVTDADIQHEVSSIASSTGLVGRTQSGHSPLVAVLMPRGVEVCLDATDKLCSANNSLTPPPPTLTTSTTTNPPGPFAAGTYHVEVTYVTGSGETLPSASESITTDDTTSAINIASPPSDSSAGVTGWYAYVTQVNGTNYTRQQLSPTAINSPLTLTAPPTSSGPAPPTPPPGHFCSYHSQVAGITYVVQPWTSDTQCDEPNLPALPQPSTVQQRETDAGVRLVNPLSQAQIAALVNPALNGWFAADGSEINDNGLYHIDPSTRCTPLGPTFDTAAIGSGSYVIQREFNNAAAIEAEPYTYGGCAPLVNLSPTFVVPSAVSPGDEVQFDGSPTASTLIVPNAGYKWNFGDGTTAIGPSVVHSYTKGGTFTVTLTVTDRGGNQQTLSQTIQVLGSTGQPVTTTTTTTTTKTGLHVRILLLPQALHTVLRRGVMLRVTSNERANGIAWVSVPRSLAKRAHIKLGHKPYVVIGVGTVSGITDGTVSLHLKLSRSVAAKLRHLRHVTLSVRLSLVGTGGNRVAVDAAGRY